MSHQSNLLDGATDDCRVDGGELCDIGMVVVAELLDFEISRFHKELADQDHGDDHADHAERVCDSRGQCRVAAGQSGVSQCLRGGTEGRCVGRSTAEQTCHHRYADACQRRECQRKGGAQDDDGQTPHVEHHALVAQGAEEVGTHMQSQTVDKHRQAEGLGIVERHLVNRHADVAGYDTHEKHEGDAQRDAHDTYLA